MCVREIVAEGTPGCIHCRKCVFILVCPAVCCPLCDIDWLHQGVCRSAFLKRGQKKSRTEKREEGWRNYQRARADRVREERTGPKRGGQKDGKLKEGRMMGRLIEEAVLVLFCSHGHKLSPTPSLPCSIDLMCYSWLKMTYCSCLHALCLRVCLQYININFCSPPPR